MAVHRRKAGAGPSGDALIVSKARVRKLVRGMNVSLEFYLALDREVRRLIEGAEERALGNRRRTVMPVDVVLAMDIPPGDIDVPIRKKKKTLRRWKNCRHVQSFVRGKEGHNCWKDFCGGNDSE